MATLHKMSYFVHTTLCIGVVTVSACHPNVYTAEFSSATPWWQLPSVPWGDADHRVLPHQHNTHSSKPLLSQYGNAASSALHLTQFLIIKESPRKDWEMYDVACEKQEANSTA